MDGTEKDGDRIMYAIQQAGGSLMQEVLGSMAGDRLKQERFMQCLICDRKRSCAESGKVPPDNRKTGMCSRLLLPGETRSVGETRGRRKGTKNSYRSKYPSDAKRKERDPMQQWLKDMDKSKGKKG